MKLYKFKNNIIFLLSIIKMSKDIKDKSDKECTKKLIKENQHCT